MQKAKDVMTTEFITVSANTTIAEAIQLMKDNAKRGLVVLPQGEEDAYGIVTETDIAYKVIAYAKDPKGITVGEIMTKPCIVVNPDLSVEYVARLFANTGIHRAPVIREKLLGVISITDIIRESMWWQG